MNLHYINIYEVGVHVVSTATILTLAISLAHRAVQMAYESFSVEYPDAKTIAFISPSGPCQKVLRASGDFFGHVAQAGKEFIAPKQQWDGQNRRGEIAQSQAAGK